LCGPGPPYFPCHPNAEPENPTRGQVISLV
jgi:hypothetical protein